MQCDKSVQDFSAGHRSIHYRMNLQGCLISYYPIHFEFPSEKWAESRFQPWWQNMWRILQMPVGNEKFDYWDKMSTLKLEALTNSCHWSLSIPPLKRSGKLWFFDVFEGYRKEISGMKWINTLTLSVSTPLKLIGWQ